MAEWFFWIALLLVLYTFAGYTVLLALIVRIKRACCEKPNRPDFPGDFPEICLFVTAYNEVHFASAKVENSFNLNYPKHKLSFLWVTDGSTDGTPELLTKYPQLQVEHVAERRGKVHAMNRGMQFVKSELVVFTDANTLLAPDSLLHLAKHFSDERVAVVAGEKRVRKAADFNVAASGENLYWNLESKVKQLESELSSVVGAAGELFAMRRNLFQAPAENCLLDDFQLSMKHALAGYKVLYEPMAVAWESGSANVREELKRKTRIAAGGLQAMVQLPALLNPFQTGWLSFQYFSHKVLRWTLAPWALLIALVCNFILLIHAASNSSELIYIVCFAGQAGFYLLALLGFITEGTKLGNKLFYIPYYFTAINLATILGQFRFVGGKQQVNWEKAQRA